MLKIEPGSALDCAMNCGWWDEDQCRCPPEGNCYGYEELTPAEVQEIIRLEQLEEQDNFTRAVMIVNKKEWVDE